MGIISFFYWDWEGEQGQAALPCALFLPFDSFFCPWDILSGGKEYTWFQATPGLGEEGEAQWIKGYVSAANLIV